MGKELTDRERAIIQQIILDRWNPRRLNKKISSHFGLTINQVRHIRSKSAFETEYKKQLAIYQQSFDDICLADRKERVLAIRFVSLKGAATRTPETPSTLDADCECHQENSRPPSSELTALR
jgi:hypothetical protein